MTRIFCAIVFVLSAFVHEAAGEVKLRRQAEYADSIAVLFVDGRWDDGYRLLEDALGKYPEDARINSLAGEYYFHSADYVKARYFLERAVGEDSGLIRAKYLLVAVGERTGHYSDAICHVNELLEIMPYHQDLWMKKISLYRAQGNDEEADRLMRRLRQIFPNDTTVLRSFRNRLEEDYVNERKAGRRAEAIAPLEELVALEPDDVQLRVDLANLLMQEGRQDEAMEVVRNGLAHVPDDVVLARMYAGMLAERHRYSEAVDFLDGMYRRTGSMLLLREHDNMLAEAAEKSKGRDSYEIYRKIYARTGSPDALDNLIAIAVSRDYYSDALYYIGEAKRVRGETFGLLYREYELKKRFSPATGLLERIDRLYPGNYDVRQELSGISYREGNGRMDAGEYAEALDLFRKSASYAMDSVAFSAARMKCYSALVRLERYGDAAELLDSLDAEGSLPVNFDMVQARAELMSCSGNTAGALDLLFRTVGREPGKISLYSDIYEEYSVSYIRGLIEAGALKAAGRETERLLMVSPRSVPGLGYAISLAGLTGDSAGLDSLTAEATLMYPDDPSFAVKRSSVLASRGDYSGALALVEPFVDSLSGNRAVTGSYAFSSEKLAMEYAAKDSSGVAMDLLDRALEYEPENQSLLYAKGLVFERMHQYDSAFFYQRKYRPADTEYYGFNRRLQSLLRETHKNSISYSAVVNTSFESGAMSAVHTFDYWRMLGKGHLNVSADYSGRSGPAGSAAADAGGFGFQFRAEYGRVFCDRLEAVVRASASTAHFPHCGLSAEVTGYLPKSWEVSGNLGYRRLRDIPNRNLYQAGAGFAKNWDVFRLAADCDVFKSCCDVYFNAGAEMKYYPGTDGKTSVALHVSGGTAPEEICIDLAIPVSFRHMNATVGACAEYFVNSRLSVLADCSFYTYFVSGASGGKYNNMLISNVQLSFYF